MLAPTDSDRRPGGRTASTTSGRSRHTRIDRHADPTPFRHSFSSNSTYPSNYVTQYHTSRRIPQNRPQTARSTMAPISRGGRPTLEDVPKKIAVSPAVCKSCSHATIVSCRSRTPTASGEAGHLVPVDLPRWSDARDRGIGRADLVCGTLILSVYHRPNPRL